MAVWVQIPLAVQKETWKVSLFFCWYGGGGTCTIGDTIGFAVRMLLLVEECRGVGVETAEQIADEQLPDGSGTVVDAIALAITV